MTAPYTSTPPTAWGWYFVKYTVASEEEIAFLTSTGDWWYLGSKRDRAPALCGLKVPTAAELHRAAECQQELLVKCAAAESRVRELQPYYDAVRQRHNGYSPSAREAMPTLKEPATPLDAIDELTQEAEEIGVEIGKRSREPAVPLSKSVMRRLAIQREDSPEDSE
jgi:hypothetical protein